MAGADSSKAGRALRVFHYCAWADRLEPSTSFLERLPQVDVSSRVPEPRTPDLIRMARLDCDWHAENVRAFSALSHPPRIFLPAQVFGAAGVMDFVKSSQRRPEAEIWWLIFMGQQPQALATAWAKLGPLLSRHGVRLLYYAFDEASRTMPCFPELAPWLDVLIHDESPLAEPSARRMRPDCLCLHRSWVANLVPFSIPFNEAPEPGILFLGSKLGLTPHRQRQINYLQARYKDRFHAIHDHSLSVADRGSVNRWSVSICPEGRKFSSRAMAATHTDRPFWSGCLGMIPVSEDSQSGGRLEPLHQAGMIMRYPHGDLAALGEACDHALAKTRDERHRVYQYFNGHETVGQVVAPMISLRS
jgi:hypothetical protein